MLILTRRVGETVVIGDQIASFTVLGVKGTSVRIGVVADPALSVHREEVYLKIQKEKQNKDQDKN